MIVGIEHIWFDFTDTIASMDRGVLDGMLHALYGEVHKRDVTPELVEEYKREVQEKKSNSAVFSALGLPAGYVSDKLASHGNMYRLTDENIPTVLKTLRTILPISIFSNARLDVMLPSLGIDPKLFTHILGPDQVQNPKPALDGFYKMIELSNTLPKHILFVGDDVHKDLLPAKGLGIKTGLLWQTSPEADYCFSDFSDILKRFQ